MDSNKDANSKRVDVVSVQAAMGSFLKANPHLLLNGYVFDLVPDQPDKSLSSELFGIHSRQQSVNSAASSTGVCHSESNSQSPSLVHSTPTKPDLVGTLLENGVIGTRLANDLADTPEDLDFDDFDDAISVNSLSFDPTFFEEGTDQSDPDTEEEEEEDL